MMEIFVGILVLTMVLILFYFCTLFFEAIGHELARKEGDKIKKPFMESKVGKVLGYTGVAIFTFGVMPWVYLFLVLFSIAVLGFFFGF